MYIHVQFNLLTCERNSSRRFIERRTKAIDCCWVFEVTIYQTLPAARVNAFSVWLHECFGHNESRKHCNSSIFTNTNAQSLTSPLIKHNVSFRIALAANSCHSPLTPCQVSLDIWTGSRWPVVESAFVLERWWWGWQDRGKSLDCWYQPRRGKCIKRFFSPHVNFHSTRCVPLYPIYPYIIIIITPNPVEVPCCWQAEWFDLIRFRQQKKTWLRLSKPACCMSIVDGEVSICPHWMSFPCVSHLIFFFIVPFEERLLS